MKQWVKFLLIFAVSQSVFNSQDCQTNEDCPSNKFYCSSKKVCETKLFPILSRRIYTENNFRDLEIFGILAIAILSGIGSISGIAGGSIVVPFSLLTLKFSPKESTAFSNIIALVLSIIKSFLCFYKNDPDKPSKTLIGTFKFGASSK